MTVGGQDEKKGVTSRTPSPSSQDHDPLMVHPIVVGGGKRLFGEGSETKKLRLVETEPFSSGVVVLRYERA
jgi:dihydrofolate reductase